MLTAHQTRTLSSNYMVYHDGRFVLRWKKSWWGSHEATFDLGGRPYWMSAPRSQSGNAPRGATLSGPGFGSVEAGRESGQGWAVVVYDRRYWLRRASIWRRDVDLVWDGQVVGSVRFAGRFRKVVTADLPAEMSLPTQIFVVATALAA